jgi:hypothetical protein
MRGGLWTARPAAYNRFCARSENPKRRVGRAEGAMVCCPIAALRQVYFPRSTGSGGRAGLGDSRMTCTCPRRRFVVAAAGTTRPPLRRGSGSRFRAPTTPPRCRSDAVLSVGDGRKKLRTTISPCRRECRGGLEQPRSRNEESTPRRPSSEGRAGRRRRGGRARRRSATLGGIAVHDPTPESISRTNRRVAARGATRLEEPVPRTDWSGRARRRQLRDAAMRMSCPGSQG